MIVEELNYEECRQVLAEARFARLACAAHNQPYIVPMFLAYHRRPNGEESLYGFTTLGQKVEWMRANPRVCVEVDDVSNPSQWVSVVALGNYVELPNIHEPPRGRAPARSMVNHFGGLGARATEKVNEQLLVHRLLEARAMWWEPAASVRTCTSRGQQPNRISPVFYEIRLTEVTGLRARREAAPTMPTPPPSAVEQPNFAHWLRGLLKRWRTAAVPHLWRQA